VELIVTEKEIAARRIASIFSGESADVERENGVNVYKWGGKRCVGLSGHVVEVDFPPEYGGWRDVEPRELVSAEVEKHPSRENIVRTLRLLARQANRVTIATDYDREGELIGKEAYELVQEVSDAPVDRVRFSSITEREVTEAFADPDAIDFDLAAAGEARQVIDLVWGAALTRFLSLSAKRFGGDFISVGRVQSPTLKLIVDREREIEAFDPQDYWELFVDLGAEGERFEAQYFYDDDGSEADRVWNEERASAVYEAIEASERAPARSVRRRQRTDSPPVPFSTTKFISAASSLGLSAERAMSTAEDLYTEGYITYPRTDNTVYPDDLDVEDLLEALSSHREFAEDAEALAESGDLSPTEGDEETTDHPPIHPTGELPGPGELGGIERRVYELVVRRFFATVADSAIWEHLRVVVGIEDGGGEGDGEDEHRLKANGKRLLEPGYHAVYPYVNASENHVPDVEEGDVLAVTDSRIEAKETQPPRRYGQSRLIERMEAMEIGTKCLTGDTPVLVADAGEVRRVPIEDAFDNGRTVLADGDTDIAISENGPATLSFVESDNRIVERPQTLVSERPLEGDEEIYEVSTSAGSFSATSDHPVYRRTADGFETVRLMDLAPGEELLSARRPPSTPEDRLGTVVSWKEFAANSDISTKLYGTECADDLQEHRNGSGETQAELAEKLGTYAPQISRYENDRMDVPVWLLGELDLRPRELHGLNDGCRFSDPFPIEWSPALARLLAGVLGDGSIHVDREENTVDARYHNTDRRLIDRFAGDVETVFGVQPSVRNCEGHKSHHKRKYWVQLPGAVARVLLYVLDTVTESGCPQVPEKLQSTFVGALFDDEGYLSTNGKGFISNTDHDLLSGVAGMLANQGIDSQLDEQQHKLYFRGRKRLERFLDAIPIAADEKFYRGLRSLRQYDVTQHKARILQAMAREPRTSDELASIVELSRGRTTALLDELRAVENVRKHIEGSNRNHDRNRTLRYSVDGFDGSIYATVLGMPATATVTAIEERDYDGAVYDLTIDEAAPNFAVQGGPIVHNSTRHNTIEKLYDRGYVENDPPVPTGLARAVVDAAESFAAQIVDEGMTSELERDMAAIARGEATLEEVTDESREMLGQVFAELADSREAIGEHLRKSLKADKTLGPCPTCGSDLLVRQSRQGSHFVGCDAYPDCEYTLPLPNGVTPQLLDERCEEHDLRHVKIPAGRGTFVHGCPQCEADAADDTEDRVIGTCPECGSSEGGELAIKRLRSGSRLVGCTRYPDCEHSLPLPRRGEIEVTEERCAEHDLPELLVANGEEPWELGCPICNFREYEARQEATTLTDLEGVGEKTAEKLEAAGVETVADLSAIEADTLATDVDGVSADRIREWQGQESADGSAAD